jgi:hypothetical protein
MKPKKLRIYSIENKLKKQITNILSITAKISLDEDPSTKEVKNVNRH